MGLTQVSWILRGLRENLARERKKLEILLQQGDIYRALTLANSIAQSTGRSFGVEMSLNFPAGQSMPSDATQLGTSNVSIIIAKGRRKFERVMVDMVRTHAAEIGESVGFEPVSVGYEGFNVITDRGRITVLPGAIYLWLPIDTRVERFLDWLFVEEYGKVPPAD